MACGFCGSAFVDGGALGLMMQGQSSKMNPVESGQCIPPQGYGLKGGGYGSQWKQFQQFQQFLSTKGKGKDQGNGNGKGQGQGSTLHLAGKGAKGNGKDQGNGKGQGSNGQIGKVNGKTVEPNFWQRRRAKAELATPTKDGENVIVITTEDPKQQEVNEILDRMNTVQAMISSLAGKQDNFSNTLRQQLTDELQNLRIKKTKTKSLEDQQEVLTNLVESRKESIEKAQIELDKAMDRKEKANVALAEAESALLAVNLQIDEEDTTMNNDIGCIPESFVSQAQLLANKLPVDKVGVFNECMNMLQQILASVQVKEDPLVKTEDSKMVATTMTTTTLVGQKVDMGGNNGNVGNMGAAMAGTQPTCTDMLSFQFGAKSDPYTGVCTPRRGLRRARSLEPPGSPGMDGDRSRSNSINRRLRGKQPVPSSQDKENILPMLALLPTSQLESSFSRKEEHPIAWS
jgi:hypothetical protein